MTLQGLPVQLLDEHVIEQFLNDHLPCRRRCCAFIMTCMPRWVTCWSYYENKARGLSAGTRRDWLRTVQRLLMRKFAGNPIVIADLHPEDVRQFIAEQLKLGDITSHASALASALRAYLRYRMACGDQVHGLLGVISSPVHWRLASLPHALTPAEVARLLKSFNSTVPSPKRGYAIVRCMVDMGLRSGEVADLELTDIDWLNGTVTLYRTKSRRQDILPLPVATGQALADYVRDERPKTTNPAVFIRVLAPRDQPIGVDAIRRIIREAFRRIGIAHGRSHALRHTLACRLVNHGSSLKEVADVLRHRALDTSLIYAKLDNHKLNAVVLPWPGSAT
jgi:integrase